ncbi:hypothetical protein ACX0HA_10680 [Flavobacterium hauense]
MKTVSRIIFIALNFLMPFVLVMLIIIINFFVHGEGPSSIVSFEKYNIAWLAGYAILAALHLLLFFKYLKFALPSLKIVLSALLAVLYGYYATQL